MAGSDNRSSRNSSGKLPDSGPAARERPGLLEAESARPGSLPDLLRRAVAVGLSGLFTTEAALRGALGDTVPQEWIDFATEQSERTRSEFIQRMAQEFAGVLEKVDVTDLVEQLLEGRTIEVHAKIRLGERDSGEREDD